MEKPTVNHATFMIKRTYPVPPERVFAAFADPQKKRRWYAESRELESHELEFRVGGLERSRSRMGENTPFPGIPLANDTVYQDIVPNRRIVFAYTMTIGDRRISASLATVELLPDNKGTELVFTEQAAFFEGGDGPQLRERGWQKLLERLETEFTR